MELLRYRVERVTAALKPFFELQDPNHEQFVFDSAQYHSFPYVICPIPAVYLSKDVFTLQECTPAPSSTLNFQPQRTRMMEPLLTEMTSVPSMLELALNSAYASRDISQLHCSPFSSSIMSRFYSPIIRTSLAYQIFWWPNLHYVWQEISYARV